MEKTSELYNDFKYLGRLENVRYEIDDRKTQFLEIVHPDNFKITITVPDGIFEWFVDFSDTNGNKLVSDWDDGYGEPKDILKLNRQKAVDDFVQDILTHGLRLVVDEKQSKKIAIEIFRDNSWSKFVPW